MTISNHDLVSAWGADKKKYSSKIFSQASRKTLRVSSCCSERKHNQRVWCFLAQIQHLLIPAILFDSIISCNSNSQF